MPGTLRLAIVVVLTALMTTPLGAQVKQVDARRPRPVAARSVATMPLPTAPTVAGSLTNDEVVRMVRAGLDDAVIIGVIGQASGAAFSTGADALIALKEAKVSDDVIASIVRHGAAKPVATPAAPSAPPHARSRAATLGITEAGIFLAQADALQLLEPTGFTQGKTGGVFTSALTYGIKKAKWKAVVHRPRASIRVAGTRATFYFAFEKLGAGLSHTGGGLAGWLNGASSPNEFVLARMTAKDNGRELVLGEFGMWGASSGARSQDTVEMTIERLEPGLYKVVTGPLEPGREYCFFYATGAQGPGVGTTSAGTLFDFGVDGQ